MSAKKLSQMSRTSEKSNSGSDGLSRSFYFLNRESKSDVTSDAVRDADGGPVIDFLPPGASPEDFDPRPVIDDKEQASNQSKPQQQEKNNGSLTDFFSGLKKRQRQHRAAEKEVKPRKVPIKVEPKVYFGNERTFLAWMRLSFILAGGAVAILGFASDQNPFSELYGYITVPVCIAFILYPAYSHMRRNRLIRNRLAGPYEDTTGPTVLAIFLMFSIVAQFAVKIYAFMKEYHGTI